MRKVEVLLSGVEAGVLVVAVTYDVRLNPIPVPEEMAEFSAAPADGEDVAAAAFGAPADIPEEISLANDDAGDVTKPAPVVQEVLWFAVTTLPSSRTAGRRNLARLLSSMRVVDGVAVECTRSVLLQTAFHDRILALVEATHLPEGRTKPTRLEQL